MISKSTAKFIKSLQLKKYRKKEQSFLVEGEKSVLEVLRSTYEVMQVFATDKFLEKYPFVRDYTEPSSATEKELSTLGTLQTNDTALAVVKMKEQEEVVIPSDEWVIGLDNINDPGNLGTIIRIADWYGINKIMASEDTADFYNPKVIAASKGSFCRVEVNYVELKQLLMETSVTSYGAMMDGENVHTASFGLSGILVMGNEANGISPEIQSALDKRLTIPRYGTTESLNVAMATAIICDNIKRVVGGLK